MHATCYVRTIREIYITVLKSANYEAPNYVGFFLFCFEMISVSSLCILLYFFVVRHPQLFPPVRVRNEL